MAADAAKLDSADTVLGKPIAIKVVDGKVTINDATVAATRTWLPTMASST